MPAKAIPIQVATPNPVEIEVPPVQQTGAALTNWNCFNEAQIVPIEIMCQDYYPAQRVDSSCHTRLQIKASAILGHMQPEHGAGGGFRFTLKQTERPIKIWNDLKESGVELHDFRCDICDAELPLNPRYILKHFKAHSGKTRNVEPGGRFWMTLKSQPKLEEDYED